MALLLFNNFKNYNNHILQSMLIILAYLIVIVNSQEVPQNSKEVEMFNKTLVQYNKTLTYFNDMEKKMEKITLNIALKIRFRKIILHKLNIEKKVTKIKKELNKTEYDNKQIIDDINSVDKDMKQFEHKYNKFNEIYNECERTKDYLGQFLKIFFITLLIVVVIILLLIGIVSLYIIKRQKKYYILQEEITISESKEGKDINKKSDINNYDKDINSVKSSTQSNDDSFKPANDKKIHIKGTNLTSHDEMNKNP